AASGAYDIVVRPMDAQDREGASGGFRFTLPWTHPTVELLSPAAGAVLDGVVDVTVAAASDRPPLRLRVQLGERTVYDGEAASGAAWSYAWNTSAWAEAPYVVRATVTDANGVEAVESAQVWVSRPPSMYWSWPFPNHPFRGTVTLYVSASDGNGIDRVEWAPNDEPWRLMAGLTAPWNTSEHADGPHRLRVRAVDQTGRATEESREFLVDNTPPQVEIVRPRPGILYSPAGSFPHDIPGMQGRAVIVGPFTIELDLSDNVEVDYFQLCVHQPNLLVPACRQYNDPQVDPWSPIAGWARPGPARVEVRAYDTAGNPSALAVVDVVKL
ncbi:MAG TPA: Ig-like domain-containing protein, partial [Candidatus Thermoplasmatota archaeon]|nr:Ig-like domain-containing protein [Candidatus Thermoplasmatota archaeon]